MSLLEEPIRILRSTSATIRSLSSGRFVVILSALALAAGWSAWERRELQTVLDRPAVTLDCSAFERDPVAALRCSGESVVLALARVNEDFDRRNEIGIIGWVLVLIVASALVVSWIYFGKRSDERPRGHGSGPDRFVTGRRLRTRIAAEVLVYPSRASLGSLLPHG
jgi:hypothetical protein